MEPIGMLAHPSQATVDAIKNKSSVFSPPSSPPPPPVVTATVGRKKKNTVVPADMEETNLSDSTVLAKEQQLPSIPSGFFEPVLVDLKDTPPDHVISMEEATGISSGCFGAAFGNYLPGGVYRALDYPNYDCWSPATGERAS
jgi:hypothetical protein